MNAAAPTLWLATASIATHRYMGATSYGSVTLLVWATSRDEAANKFRAHVERDDPYGVSVSVSDLILSEAIS